jgi:hypothetical protein
MANKESERPEFIPPSVFFGSNQNKFPFISFTTGATGATSIGGTSTTIINTMLYENVRKVFVSQTNTAITARIEKVLNLILYQNILIPRPDSLRNYLLQHLDMLNVLPLICKIAVDRVDSSSQLSLEVYQDPEIQDEYLTLYVRRPQYDESISRLIDEISAECQEYLSESEGWLIVTTDFRPPQ